MSVSILVSRNGFSRGEEHLANLEAADENKSILKLNSIHHHNGRRGREYPGRWSLEGVGGVLGLWVNFLPIFGKNSIYHLLNFS